MKSIIKIISLLLISFVMFTCRNIKINKLSEIELNETVAKLIKDVPEENTTLKLFYNSLSDKLDSKENIFKKSKNKTNSFTLIPDVMECGGCIKKYNHIIPLPPLKAAHYVTGGKPPLTLIPLISPSNNNKNSEVIKENSKDHFSIGNGDSVFFTANFDIVVPVQKHDLIEDTMEIIIKSFIGENEIPANNIEVFAILLQESKLGYYDEIKYNLNYFGLPVKLAKKKMSTCESQKCIRVYVEGRTKIEFLNHELTSKISIAFQILDSKISHADNLGRSIAISNNNKLSNINQFSQLQIEYIKTNLCSRTPVTIQDFIVADNAICGHIADHTMITKINLIKQ